MQTLFSSALICMVILLSGCAFTPPVNPGDSEAHVLTRLGKPSNIYQNGQNTLLEYSTGPFGQSTFMATINSNKQLISYEQVLTVEKFSSIKVNQFNQADVLRVIGKPIEIIDYQRLKLSGWNYAYKENGVWNSMMTVYFDHQGIVRKLENGPDSRFERTRFGL